jgi:DNA polymerase-3 subunit beta
MFTLDHDVIKALLIAAPKRDVRYYLVGACIDVRESDITLVATDGHMLLAVPVPQQNIESAIPPGQYIIPRATLEAVKPAKVGRTTLPIRVSVHVPEPAPDPDRPGVMLKHAPTITLEGATTATTAPVDARFPDWRKVLPTTSSGELQQFDPALIARWDQIHSTLGASENSFPRIHHNGANPAFIGNLWRDAIGVLMPVRDDTDVAKRDPLPSWAVA